MKPVHQGTSPRLIELAAGSSPADKILALAGNHQQILAALEDAQAKQMIDAWQQARTDIGQRMEQLYAQTFGSGKTPDPKDVIEWTQRAEMLATIDGRLDSLGVTTQALQGQAWSAGAEMGWAHANAELGFVVDDFGGKKLLGRSTFGKLDQLRHDLAMTAAVNETKNLAPAMRAAVHRELIAGATQGEGIRKLRNRLNTVLDGAKVNGQSRADLISRWAAIKGHNAAREDAYHEAAEVIPGLQKMWLVQNDERICPHCLAHHGEVVEVDGEFDKDRTFAGTPQKVYGDVLEYPPLHPRCRCTITTWHPRWASLTKLTPEQLQDQAQEHAVASGFVSAPKPFTKPKLPNVGSLRSTREGRRVIHASQIAEIPDSVREATIERYLACQVAP